MKILPTTCPNCSSSPDSLISIDDNNTVIFHEEQKFVRWVRWLVILPLILFLLVGKELIKQPIAATVGLTIATSVAVLLWISKLKTEVRSDGLYVQFFPFHIHFKKFAFEEISKYYAREYSPLLDYGGWGIRYGFDGKAYNPRGNKGLQIVFKNGKKLLIGSQKPQELVAAIESVIKN